MDASGLEFWGAVLAMALITYLTRALPFMLPPGSRLLRHMGRDGSALAALGPSLLAGIAAAVIVPDLYGAQAQQTDIAAYVGGLAATVVAARLSRNAGAAVLAGMAAYGLLLAL